MEEGDGGGMKTSIKGRDPVSQLYRAVIHYVEKNGGKLTVVGGIQVIQFDDNENQFTIGVKCYGKKPTFKATIATNARKA
jgi:hypothetical protein